MNIEFWREVDEYGGRYLVSSYGNVFSLSTNKILRHYVNKKGYSLVTLTANYVRKNFLVSRLVALSFICNSEGLPQVNHIDEIKSNNYMNNLEWVTAKENINHGTAIIRGVIASDRKAIGIKNRKPINEFSKEGCLIKKWGSISEIHESTGYSLGNINQCCKYVRKSAYGRIWRYANKNLEEQTCKSQ